MAFRERCVEMLAALDVKEPREPSIRGEPGERELGEERADVVEMGFREPLALGGVERRKAQCEIALVGTSSFCSTLYELIFLIFLISFYSPHS